VTAAGENGRDPVAHEASGSADRPRGTTHGGDGPVIEPLPDVGPGVANGRYERLADGRHGWAAGTTPAPVTSVPPGGDAAGSDRFGYAIAAGQGEAPYPAEWTGRGEWHSEAPGGTVDDGPGTGDLADDDDFWSAVLRDDTECDWLDSPSRPRPLDETRPYGRPGGLAEADPAGQISLAQAVSGRFPDPRGTWIRLINAEGPTEDAFRSNNAVDCALAVMSTWHGEPVVAARRMPEYDAQGRPVLTGEIGGVARAEEWLGHRFEYVGHGRRAYVAIAQRLIFGGHGAAAVLITRWPGGGSHAWNAVNCRGEVLWIDAQRGHMAVEPPYEDVTGVFAVVIDRQGRRL